MTAIVGGGEGVEGSSKKAKAPLGIDNSVVLQRGVVIRRINGNGKIKLKKSCEQ